MIVMSIQTSNTSSDTEPSQPHLTSRRDKVLAKGRPEKRAGALRRVCWYIGCAAPSISPPSLRRSVGADADADAGVVSLPARAWLGTNSTWGFFPRLLVAMRTDGDAKLWSAAASSRERMAAMGVVATQGTAGCRGCWPVGTLLLCGCARDARGEA